VEEEQPLDIKIMKTIFVNLMKSYSINITIDKIHLMLVFICD